MRDIIKVSISGIAFILDDQAYQILDTYIRNLERGYKDNPDGKEIIADIEARMAEIILSKQDSDVIVQADLVSKIIDQLGLPEGIQGEEGSSKVVEEQPLKQFPRRLYRNPEGAKVGGVCSGLGTFFDVDAVWIRVGFFLPLLLLIITSTIHFPFVHGFFGTSFGALVVSYIILWFAIPLARTPRQMLEMRGEKITVSSIHNSLKDDFMHISGDTKRGRQSASVFAELAYVFGRIILFCLKAAALLIGFAFAIGAIILMVAFCTFLFGNVHGSMMGFVSDVQMIGISNSFYMALLSLVALVPVAMLTYLLLRLVFNLPANRTVLSVIALLWLVMTVYAGYVTANNIDNIKSAVNMQIVNEQCEGSDVETIGSTVETEGIIEGDSTRSDSVVVKIR